MSCPRTGWRYLAGLLLMLLPSCAQSDDIAGGGNPSNRDGSPLEQLVGVPLFDQAEVDLWMQELDAERRLLVAECMRAEGFDSPIDVGVQIQRLQTESIPGTREFAQEFGFGIVARFRQAIFDPSVDYSTPEDRYIVTLTEGEREAYLIALTGADDSSPGCEDKATEEVSQVFETSQALLPLAASFVERIAADSRMLDLTQRWTTCMASVGFPDVQPTTIQSSFSERLFELVVNGTIFRVFPCRSPAGDSTFARPLAVAKPICHLGPVRFGGIPAVVGSR